jgi:hypothetical protein
MTTKDAVRAFLDSWQPRTGRAAILDSPTAELTADALSGARFGGSPHDLFRDCRRAIQSALDVPAPKAVIDGPSAKQPLGSIAYSVDYADGLAFRLRERHWPRLDALLDRAFGEKRDAFKDVAWGMIGRNVRPQVPFWSDPFSPPSRATVGDNLCTAIFYFVAFAAAGDGHGAEQFANLVRLLPHAIPVGERPSKSGEWLVSLRPVIR